ncbi:helix-turn-helix domain-containing protein [Streptomyces gardneri]|uniref:helix-turn-helix domain-containing protein n=1 Tax=Streptomyces gardneri TaxID=66892 RepID=UPI000AB8FBF5|nr:helix-turn-helix domain-containing protein [Streptomyces gardneri]QPK50194.1 helix-turn-helix domain-containing protein [Streptomyces gardneri]WRK41799.1 helix-turn-helix domain-containing protein [Streptomyces venezuelae]
MVTDEVASLIRRRYREGVSVRAVARELGISKNTVQRKTPAAERRSAVDAARQRHKNQLEAPDARKLRLEVVRLYRSGMSSAEVASALGITKPMVWSRLTRQLRRSRSDTASLASRRVASRLPEEEIIRRYAAGESLTALGLRYGVHSSTIRRRIPKDVIRPRGRVSPTQRRGPRDLPTEEIRQRYREGESAYSLAKAFAVSQTTIRLRIPDDQWRGHPPRKPAAPSQPQPKSPRRIPARRTKLSLSPIQILTRYRAGESATSIASTARVSCKTIIRLTPDNERRTSEQALRVNRPVPELTGEEIRLRRARGETVREITEASGLSVKTVRNRQCEDGTTQ